MLRFVMKEKTDIPLFRMLRLSAQLNIKRYYASKKTNFGGWNYFLIYR
jgi:hypothetical protein